MRITVIGDFISNSCNKNHMAFVWIIQVPAKKLEYFEKLL